MRGMGGGGRGEDGKQKGTEGGRGGIREEEERGVMLGRNKTQRKKEEKKWCTEWRR